MAELSVYSNLNLDQIQTVKKKQALPSNSPLKNVLTLQHFPKTLGLKVTVVLTCIGVSDNTHLFLHYGGTLW